MGAAEVRPRDLKALKVLGFNLRGVEVSGRHDGGARELRGFFLVSLIPITDAELAGTISSSLKFCLGSFWVLGSSSSFAKRFAVLTTGSRSLNQSACHCFQAQIPPS